MLFEQAPQLAYRYRDSDSITWASFMLYGDPTFRLVR